MQEDSFVGLCAGLQKGSPLTCSVKVTGQGLSIFDERKLILELPYQGLDVFRSGMNNRYLSFQNTSAHASALLMVSDRNIVRQIVQSGAPGTLLHGLERLRRSATSKHTRHLIVFLAVLVGVLGIIILGSLVLRGMEKKIVASIPIEWEQELGRSASRKIGFEQSFCENPAIIHGLSEIGGRLVSATGLSYYRFEVRVIATDDVNGFALPGGYIFLTQGLVEFAETGEEVAGVIAHEMQHVQLRHGLGNIARRAGFRLLLSAFLGDMDRLERFFAASAAELVTLKFSREQEEEADRQALSLLRNAHIDAEGLPSFLERMTRESNRSKMHNIFNIFSTHPGPEERTKFLRARLRDVPQQQASPFEVDWSSIRLNCPARQ